MEGHHVYHSFLYGIVLLHVFILIMALLVDWKHGVGDHCKLMVSSRGAAVLHYSVTHHIPSLHLAISLLYLYYLEIILLHRSPQ